MQPNGTQPWLSISSGSSPVDHVAKPHPLPAAAKPHHIDFINPHLKMFRLGTYVHEDARRGGRSGRGTTRAGSATRIAEAPRGAAALRARWAASETGRPQTANPLTRRCPGRRARGPLGRLGSRRATAPGAGGPGRWGARGASAGWRRGGGAAGGGRQVQLERWQRTSGVLGSPEFERPCARARCRATRPAVQRGVKGDLAPRGAAARGRRRRAGRPARAGGRRQAAPPQRPSPPNTIHPPLAMHALHSAHPAPAAPPPPLSQLSSPSPPPRSRPSRR